MKRERERERLWRCMSNYNKLSLDVGIMNDLKQSLAFSFFFSIMSTYCWNLKKMIITIFMLLSIGLLN